MTDQAESLRVLSQQRWRERPEPARVIAITSGKGGVGKTNLVVNLAACLSRMGYRTAVLDGDLGMANVDILLGLNPPYNIVDVIAGRKRLMEVAAIGPLGMQVFAGGSGLYELANLNIWQLEKFTNSLAELDEVCDVLLIDTGAGLSQGVVRLVLSAVEVIVVTTPEPTALADAYGIVKVVARRSPGTRVHVAVNMAYSSEEGEALFGHFQRATRRFLELELNYLGYVPFDNLVSRCVQEQCLFTVEYPNSKVARAVEQIAHNLVGVQVPMAGGLKGLVTRMARLLGAGQ